MGGVEALLRVLGGCRRHPECRRFTKKRDFSTWQRQKSSERLVVWGKNPPKMVVSVKVLAIPVPSPHVAKRTPFF